MKKGTKKILALLLTVAMTTSMAACGKKDSTKESSTGENVVTEAPTTASGTETEATGAEKYPEFLTIDVFATESNNEGLQTGWFAKIVKDKFNMELNVISPNVSGGGDTLFTTRSAAGNLGDIVIIGSENGKLQNTVLAGLLVDITDKVAASPILSQYSAAIDKSKGMVSDGKLYAIPKSVSLSKSTDPSENIDFGYGNFVRWDYYLEAGAPELNTLEDVIPLLKKIQEAHPTTDSGNPAYGMSLFKDWDGNMMCLAQQPARMYGYQETGFVLHKVDGSEYDSIIDSDSIYVRGLKLFFEANKAGILDPESTTQNWDTLYNKFLDGAVYWTPWSFQSYAYNIPANTSQGKGIKYVTTKDMTILSAGFQPAGTTTVIGVGSKAKDPDRMFDFIEWLYSPEGTYATGSTGPQGITWDVVDGKPKLTEFGVKAMQDESNTMVSEELGGGTWKDGKSLMNFLAVRETDIDPATGITYDYRSWETYLADNVTNLDKSWNEKNGATSMVDLVKKTNNYVVEPGTDFVSPSETTDITAVRNQCKEKIKDYSWRMCFATSDDEFNSLLTEMQETVKSLGYDQVLEFDMQCAKDRNTAYEASRASAK